MHRIIQTIYQYVPVGGQYSVFKMHFHAHDPITISSIKMVITTTVCHTSICVLLVIWGSLEDSAVSLLLLARGSTLGIWCSFIAASSLTVLCCQNINQPSHFSFPSLLHPPILPLGLWSVFMARGQPWSECEEFLLFFPLSHLINALSAVREGIRCSAQSKGRVLEARN